MFRNFVVVMEDYDKLTYNSLFLSYLIVLASGTNKSGPDLFKSQVTPPRSQSPSPSQSRRVAAQLGHDLRLHRSAAQSSECSGNPLAAGRPLLTEANTHRYGTYAALCSPRPDGVGTLRAVTNCIT